MATWAVSLWCIWMCDAQDQVQSSTVLSSLPMQEPLGVAGTCASAPLHVVLQRWEWERCPTINTGVVVATVKNNVQWDFAVGRAVFSGVLCSENHAYEKATAPTSSEFILQHFMSEILEPSTFSAYSLPSNCRQPVSEKSSGNLFDQK